MRSGDHRFRSGRGHDRPVGHVELRPIHLTANDSQLVAKKQQLRLRVANPQAHVGDVEEKPQEGVKKCEQLGSVIRRRTLHILFEHRTLHSEFRKRLVTSVDATTRPRGGDSRS